MFVSFAFRDGPVLVVASGRDTISVATSIKRLAPDHVFAIQVWQEPFIVMLLWSFLILGLFKVWSDTQYSYKWHVLFRDGCRYNTRGHIWVGLIWWLPLNMIIIHTLSKERSKLLGFFVAGLLLVNLWEKMWWVSYKHLMLITLGEWVQNEYMSAWFKIVFSALWAHHVNASPQVQRCVYIASGASRIMHAI